MIGLGVLLPIILAAIAAPCIVKHDPIGQELVDALLSPSTEHFFGTDQFGRDVYSRVVHGARISLVVGLVSTGIACLGGIPLGVLAGYRGGWVDAVIARFVDLMLSFPMILLALTIVTTLGPSLTNAMIAVGLSILPEYVRIARGSSLSVGKMEYVIAAQAIGASDLHIMLRHIFPNILLPLVVLGSLDIPAAMLAAAGLSFLGLGAQPPSPEWGAMLTSGRTYLHHAWWLTVFPGLAMMICVLAMNLVGEGLRDALDPQRTPRS